MSSELSECKPNIISFPDYEGQMVNRSSKIIEFVREKVYYCFVKQTGGMANTTVVYTKSGPLLFCKSLKHTASDTLQDENILRVHFSNLAQNGQFHDVKY